MIKKFENGSVVWLERNDQGMFKGHNFCTKNVSYDRSKDGDCDKLGGGEYHRKEGG